MPSVSANGLSVDCHGRAVDIPNQIRHWYPKSLRECDKIVQADFPRSALDVRNVDLMDPGMLGQVDLPPALFLPQLPDSRAEPDARICSHPLRIDFVFTLNSAYTLFGDIKISERMPGLKVFHGLRVQVDPGARKKPHFHAFAEGFIDSTSLKT